MTRKELSDKILELVSDSIDDPEMTYSDIQGVAMAIAINAIKE